MLGKTTRYLINDVKALTYTYDPETDHWWSEHYRRNLIKKIKTVVHLTLGKKKVKVEMMLLEGNPREYRDEAWAEVDTHKFKFRDDEFREYLKSLKSD